jgi:hypothetical protein
MTRKVWTLLAALPLATWAADAHAYSYNTCNGNAIIWNSPTENFWVNTCSMGTSGNPAHDAATNAIYKWNAGGMPLTYAGDQSSSYCQYVNGDGVNEVVIAASQSQLTCTPSPNACTWVHTDSSCIFSWSTEHLDEADVVLSPNLTSYVDEDEAFYLWSNNNQGRAVLMHEFGHAVGMQHEDRFLDVMHTNTPIPLVGGTGAHAYPFADDMNGAQLIYGRQGNWNDNDVLISAEQFLSGVGITSTEWNLNATAPGGAAGNGDPSNGSTTINRSRLGGTFKVAFDVANLSYNANTVSYQIYIADVPPPSGWNPGGLGLGAWWPLYTGSVWIGGYGWGTVGPITVTMNNQNIPTGLYWVYARINYDGTNSETPTTNDVVHVLLTINVTT